MNREEYKRIKIWEAKEGKVSGVKITDSNGKDHIIEFEEPISYIPSELAKIKSVRSIIKENESEMVLKKRKKHKKEYDITPLYDYRKPVLDAIKKLGGRTRPKDIYKDVEQTMTLKPKDLERLPSGDIRFREMVRNAIDSFKKEGILKKSYGIWELEEDLMKPEIISSK